MAYASTFCCVHSTHRKWWEFRLTHPQVPSLYISSFLFFFFSFSRSSTDSKAQSLQSKKQSWVSHGVQGQDGLSIPNSAEGNRTCLVSLLMGGQQHKEKKDECFIDPVVFAVRALASTLWKSAGEDTNYRAGPVKQQSLQQAPPITPGDSLNVV